MKISLMTVSVLLFAISSLVMADGDLPLLIKQVRQPFFDAATKPSLDCEAYIDRTIITELLLGTTREWVITRRETKESIIANETSALVRASGLRRVEFIRTVTDPAEMVYKGRNTMIPPGTEPSWTTLLQVRPGLPTGINEKRTGPEAQKLVRMLDLGCSID